MNLYTFIPRLIYFISRPSFITLQGLVNTIFYALRFTYIIYLFWILHMRDNNTFVDEIDDLFNVIISSLNFCVIG